MGTSHGEGSSQFYKIYLWELSQGSTLEKTCLLLPAWGEGKEPFWNTLEHPGLLTKASPQGKLITWNLTCWDIIRA